MAEKENPLLKRYPPNARFTLGTFSDKREAPNKYEEFGDSITDKESYRLSLTSKRGAIASSSGTLDKSSFMFQDGKYEVNKDFSLMLRKDLSIVEIDEYIANMEEKIKTADKELAAEIQEQISQAESKKEEIKAGEKPADKPAE